MACRIVAGYLLFQAITVVFWWMTLACYPRLIPWFSPASWPVQALQSFWPADMVFALGSLSTGLIVWWEHGREAKDESKEESKGEPTVKPPQPTIDLPKREMGEAPLPTSAWALSMLTGAALYGALYCIGVAAGTGQGWIAAALMVSMAGGNLAMMSILGFGKYSPSLFRTTLLPAREALFMTAIQFVVFWSTFLWVIPMGIYEMESRLAIPTFSHAGQMVAANLLLACASVLGLWSGYKMAWLGSGTPLPTMSVPKLVVEGPYRYIRNPMALAGILQGAAVGWMLGSYCVVVYALCGAFLWHLFVRPQEERDLLQRFGASYREYRESVGLWIPQWPSSRAANCVGYR